MMILLLVWHKVKKDATIVDVGWSVGLLAAAVFFSLNGTGHQSRRIMFGTMVVIWAARLAMHLFVNRILKHRREDGRYALMRKSLGKWAPIGFFGFFHAQTLFIVIFAIPYIGPVMNSTPFPTAFDVAGLLIWLVSIAGETTADMQLQAFKKDKSNSGKTCRRGLWKYSRHPNYFFEWLHWFSYIFLAIGSPYFYVSLSGPLIMFVFLFFITGIPHVERRALEHRSDYSDYVKHTSLFVPWFPKSVINTDISEEKVKNQ